MSIYEYNIDSMVLRWFLWFFSSNGNCFWVHFIFFCSAVFYVLIV